MNKDDNIIVETKKLLTELEVQTPIDIAAHIDYTLLKPFVSSIDIIKLCEDARREQFRCVCINPCWLELAKKHLVDSKVKLCSTISFPFGADTSETKIAAAENAINYGADEIDVVINIGFLKDHQEDKLTSEVRNIVNKCKELDQNILTKFIIETAILTNEEKRLACECIISASGDYVKTSTGFSPEGGATVEDVKLMKEVVLDRVGIKASGGIKTLGDALKLLKAGADIIGTSSGIEIQREIRSILHLKF